MKAAGLSSSCTCTFGSQGVLWVETGNLSGLARVVAYGPAGPRVGLGYCTDCVDMRLKPSLGLVAFVFVKAVRKNVQKNPGAALP